MLDRRTTTPEFERKKKLEAKAYDGLAKPDQVYGIYTLKDGAKSYFYVGIALNPNVRWGSHQRTAKNGVSVLPVYESLRHFGVENCAMEVLDPHGEYTEAEWKEFLTSLGHKLVNVAGCVDVKRKKRTTYAHQNELEGIPVFKKRTKEEDVALWAKITAAAKAP